MARITARGRLAGSSKTALVRSVSAVSVPALVACPGLTSHSCHVLPRRRRRQPAGAERDAGGAAEEDLRGHAGILRGEIEPLEIGRPP